MIPDPTPPGRLLRIATGDQPILLETLHQPTPTSLLLVAEQPPGSPAGCVLVTTETDYFTGAPVAHVEVVAVTPEAAGTGLGRVLLDRAEEWARHRGYRQITLNCFVNNQHARTVYEYLGYQPATLRYRKDLGHSPATADAPDGRAPRSDPAEVLGSE